MHTLCMKHFWKTNSDALLFKVQKEVKANTKERSRSSTVEDKRRWLKLFEPSRLDRDRRGSWSQRFTTVRKAYRFFFSLSLALLSLLISLIAHFFSCLATSLFHPHHPLHYPTHPQLFKYYFSPSCRCPPPPPHLFFFLPLFILSLPVSGDSIYAECCVRALCVNTLRLGCT